MEENPIDTRVFPKNANKGEFLSFVAKGRKQASR